MFKLLHFNMVWSKGEFLSWSLVILLLFEGTFSAQDALLLSDVANVQFLGGKHLFFEAPGINVQPTRTSKSETLSNQMKRMSDYDVKDSFESEEAENPSKERLKNIDAENYRNVLKADGDSSEVDTTSYINNNSTTSYNPEANVTKASPPIANMTLPSDQTINDTDSTIDTTTLFPEISSTPDITTTTTTSTDTSTDSQTKSSEQTKTSDYAFSNMEVTTHNSTSGECTCSCTNKPGLVAGIVVSTMILIVFLLAGTFYLFKRKCAQDEERQLLITKA